MYEYHLTFGLFDKDTKKQEIPTAEAVEKISEILIDCYSLYAFTMIECHGVYRMVDTGEIVREPSIRLEIADENDLDSTMHRIIETLKFVLNQESIMYKRMKSKIEFI